MDVDAVLADAKAAKEAGATRFCMGAAWRSPKDKDLDAVCQMVEGVKALGMESCVTLGMLTAPQAAKLKGAGLDYYNHNLDTSPEYYGEIITTRTYQDRLDTLSHVRGAGIHVCCGGIVGMGERAEDRVGMIHALCTLPAHPESVPINMLVQVEGTPVSKGQAPDALEFVRTIAVARLTMPKSMVRLSAGREDMSRRSTGAVLLRRRQFDLLRAQAADHAEPQRTPRPRAARPARHAADGGVTACATGSPIGTSPVSRISGCPTRR